ncbi:MAG: S8 family serine peptidase [Bacilli bacterium]|nr:S8 family serine peptidase [Bacilli bacterium]
MKIRTLIIPLICLMLISCGGGNANDEYIPVTPQTDNTDKDKDNEKEDVKISSLSITNPTKTTYFVGERLDLSGMIIYVNYSDGSKLLVSNNSVVVTGFNSSEEATNQVVTVTYVSVSATFTVNIVKREDTQNPPDDNPPDDNPPDDNPPDDNPPEVNPPVQKTLSSISVTPPTKRGYYIGESLDLTGMVITANYSDGTHSTIQNSNATITGFDSSRVVEDQTITVKYQNKYAYFTVYVMENINEGAEGLDPRNEPNIGDQYYLNNIGDIYTVWEKYRGRGITIAVIDVNFKPTHEDFYYKNGTSKISPKSASFTASGNNVVTNIGANYAVDPNNSGESHGTFCAGVAAAAVNGKGVAGIAPEAELMLLRTDAKPASINAAFKYAADNGARVVTISIGSYNHGSGDLDHGNIDLTTAFNSAVAYCRSKGVVVCSAAGNGGLDNNPTEYTYPGATEGVIGVGGTASNSLFAIWDGSSYNSVYNGTVYQFVDVMAPAEGMYGLSHYDSKNYDGGWNGTSFASPIVAGMAALYFEKYPTRTDDDFERDLYASCLKLSDGSGLYPNKYGYGRVDVAKLMNEKASGNVEVKISAYDWSRAYIIADGPDLDNDYHVQMARYDEYFSATIDSSKYEILLISGRNREGGTGSEIVNLLTSSFSKGHTYSLANGYLVGGKHVGHYSK